MNTADDQPKTRKWTPRKIIAAVAAGILLTCCSLTGLIMLLPESAEPEATAVSQQDRAAEIAIEEDNEPDPTATRPGPQPPTSQPPPQSQPLSRQPPTPNCPTK